MKTGVVKFFKSGQGSGNGYGFIKEDGCDAEYFVHVTGLAEGTSLNSDDKVTFDVAQGRKGPNAVNVKKVA